MTHEKASLQPSPLLNHNGSVTLDIWLDIKPPLLIEALFHRALTEPHLALSLVMPSHDFHRVDRWHALRAPWRLDVKPDHEPSGLRGGLTVLAHVEYQLGDHGARLEEATSWYRVAERCVPCDSRS